jgi:thiol-disulfide isomerase/thioredoxin
MRTRRLLACAALCLMSAAAQAFHYEDIDGRPHALSAYHGKWVVVNVWATWCAPCIHEMPELDALARSRPDVVVLGVAADNAAPARLRGFARALKVNYPIIAASREQLAQMKVTAYPTTLLFDPDGVLVATRMGQVTRRQLEEQLAAPRAK